MKIHINIINGITKILEDIIIQKLSADHALKEHIQSNPKWGSKDRKIISASVYDILRNFILLQHHFQQSSIKLIVEEHLKQGASDYIAQLSFPFEILFSIPDTINKIGTH